MIKFNFKKPDLTRLKEKVVALARKIGRRNAVTALAILLIAGAVVLNWRLFSEMGSDTGYTYLGEDTGEQPADGTPPSGEKDGSDYFALAVINRQRARDEAVEVLRMVVENSETIDDARLSALENIEKIASGIEDEANIEALVKAKGFDDCVAVIGDGSCSIIVRTDGLLPNEAAQIYEIVYRETGIEPSGVRLIENNG